MELDSPQSLSKVRKRKNVSCAFNLLVERVARCSFLTPRLREILEEHRNPQGDICRLLPSGGSRRCSATSIVSFAIGFAALRSG